MKTTKATKTTKTPPSALTRKAKAPAPEIQQPLNQVRQRGAAPALPAKAKKRDNIFSKSRDLAEDRGERKMKTTQSPQTLPHGR